MIPFSLLLQLRKVSPYTETKRIKISQTLSGLSEPRVRQFFPKKICRRQKGVWLKCYVYVTILVYEINQSPNTPRGGYTTKAFTLIELLVVIAIIGILATVVIASLNSARTKGRHASIKANLRNAVSQSNIYFNENGTYTGLCADPTIVSILASLGSSACYVHANTINDIDWGIAATFNGIHFTADPLGVLQLDAINNTTGGSTQTWDTAMASCASAGKRLISTSALKALYNITGTAPTGFSGSTYWSSISHPITSSTAYYVVVTTGSVGVGSKVSLAPVRCGS